jgi:DNA polymerase-3 subunit epsilon
LVDRVISTTEADALVAFAEGLGLGRYEVSELHQRYLEALVVVALEDAVVTEEEHEDLLQVAGLLGLGTCELDVAFSAARATERSYQPRYGRFSLTPGDVIVLTGTFSEPKEVLEAEAVAAGLVPAASLTKRTRLLVAADLDSMSGKAEKARRYGIPIVGEAALRRLLTEAGRRTEGRRPALRGSGA